MGEAPEGLLLFKRHYESLVKTLGRFPETTHFLINLRIAFEEITKEELLADGFNKEIILEHLNVLWLVIAELSFQPNRPAIAVRRNQLADQDTKSSPRAATDEDADPEPLSENERGEANHFLSTSESSSSDSDAEEQAVSQARAYDIHDLYVASKALTTSGLSALQQPRPTVSGSQAITTTSTKLTPGKS